MEYDRCRLWEIGGRVSWENRIELLSDFLCTCFCLAIHMAHNAGPTFMAIPGKTQLRKIPRGALG